MNEICELLFEALTSGGSLVELGKAMKEYETKHPASYKAIKNHRLWGTIDEAVRYETENKL